MMLRYKLVISGEIQCFYFATCLQFYSTAIDIFPIDICSHKTATTYYGFLFIVPVLWGKVTRTTVLGIHQIEFMLIDWH